jgi:hypothetical protein
MGGLPELQEKQATGTTKLSPKSKEQVISDLDYLRQQLGLQSTDGLMEETKRVIERIGSFSKPNDEKNDRD